MKSLIPTTTTAATILGAVLTFITNTIGAPLSNNNLQALAKREADAEAVAEPIVQLLQASGDSVAALKGRAANPVEEANGHQQQLVEVRDLAERYVCVSLFLRTIPPATPTFVTRLARSSIELHKKIVFFSGVIRGFRVAVVR